MRSLFFLILLFGLVSFSNAELRHAYENIVTFLGYRLELLLLPKDDRIIGMKCSAADPTTKICLERNPKYTACVGTAKLTGYGNEKITNACSLREFLSHISGGKQQLKTDPLTGMANDWREESLLGKFVGENSLSFDVDDAAKQMVKNKIGFKQGAVWCKIKDGADSYEASVRRLGHQLASLRASMNADQIGKMQYILDGIDTALTGLVTDRKCDRSGRLIEQLRAKKISPLVIESISGSRQLFNEAETIVGIRSALEGQPDAENKIQKALAALDDAIAAYNRGEQAGTHKRVIDLWETVVAQQAPPPVPEGCTPRTGAA